MNANLQPRALETLTDGSWLAEVSPGGNAKRHTPPLRVRVIDYSIDDGRGEHASYRLLTTLTDPGHPPEAWRHPL